MIFLFLIGLFLSCNSSHKINIVDGSISEEIIISNESKNIYSLTMMVKADMSKPFKIKISGDSHPDIIYEFSEGPINEKRSTDWYTYICNIEYLHEPGIVGNGEIELTFHY